MIVGNNYNHDSGSFAADDSGSGVSAITFLADGTIQFQTAAAGAAAPTPKVYIGPAGNVGIGTDPDAISVLHIKDSGTDARITFEETGTRKWYIKATSSDTFVIGLRGSSDTVDADIFRIISDGNAGFNTATPDAKLQVVGDFKTGDDNTNYMEVGTTGDVNFVGGAGLSYGSMSQMDIPTTITINTINVAEKVTGMSAGPLNVVTFSSSELTAVKAGAYAITWAVSFSMASGAGIEVEGAIGIDGVVQAEGSGHRTIGTGSDTGSMCGTAIHSLTANQTVIIMVTNESGTVNVVIDHASLMMYQIGG